MAKYFIRKYKYHGMFTEWKEVSKEVAEKKSTVMVYDEYYEIYHNPYEIKIVEG
jgi:hypothetical protein